MALLFMEQNKFTQREGSKYYGKWNDCFKNYEFLKKKMIDMLQADSADYRLQRRYLLYYSIKR